MRIFGGRHHRLTPSLFAALAVMAPVAAQAQTTGTLGGLVGITIDNLWEPFWIVLLGSAFLLGVWLVATGLSRLRDIGGSHGHAQGQAMDGITRIVGGALLVALPDTMNAGIMTFYGNITGHAMNSANGQVGGVNSCLATTGGVAGSTLTCVAHNVASNLVPVFIEVSFGLLYLIGAAMILHALYTLATSHAAGHRQIPKGWVARIVIGALICNVPHLMSAIETTMGIQNGTILDTGYSQTSNLLAYNNTSGGVLAEYSQLIGYLFQILVMFGVIAVWRGIFFLRSYAEGTGRATVGQGLTHIIGGVLLTNSKYSTCILMNTFMGAAAGAAMGFCS